MLFFCINTIALAKQYSCPPYLGEKDNILFNISIVGAWNDDPNDRNADELTPDKEVNTTEHIAQYYFLKTKYEHYKKLLVMCAYDDKRVTVNEIPKNINTCIRTFHLRSSIISFSCY